MNDYLEVITISATLYWKPVSGIIKNRLGAIDESHGLPEVTLKVLFPPTFPVKTKTFKLNYELTVKQVF